MSLKKYNGSVMIFKNIHRGDGVQNVNKSFENQNKLISIIGLKIKLQRSAGRAIHLPASATFKHHLSFTTTPSLNPTSWGGDLRGHSCTSTYNRIL